MEFIDLKRQYQLYKQEIHDEMEKVLSNAAFINGPALRDFESNLARHCGIKHVLACSSGTDALLVPMMAYGIKPGDEVVIPDFTFYATAEMVAFLGAVPVFVDVDPTTLNIDPNKIENKINDKTKGIIPVSLYGQCADFDAINSIAKKHNLWVMEDGAQSYGAKYKEKKSCTLTDVATTSFFPSKPLGCYGDGGAIFTNDDSLAAKMRIILNHGQKKRYEHQYVGLNARMDTLQAAILNVKLAHFDEEMDKKQLVAQRYQKNFLSKVQTPVVLPHNYSVWAQYTIRTKNRDEVIKHLSSKEIPTAVHYPIPLHRQEALSFLGVSDSDCPESVKASNEVLSLPIHPFMTNEEIDFVCDEVLSVIG